MSAPVPDDELLYTAMLHEHRVSVRAVGGWLESARGCHVACLPGLPIELLNGVWIEPDGEDAAVPSLERHVATLEEAGAPPYVITLGPASSAVEAEALRLGLSAVESLPAMLVMPAWLRDATPVDTVITLEDDPGDASRLLAEGFASPPEHTEALVNEAFLSAEGVDVFVARRDGVAVSTATTVHAGEGAGVYAVATPQAFRGRGYGAAVTAHAVREAFARGAAFAYLQASKMGYPVYERLGFVERFRFTVFGRPST